MDNLTHSLIGAALGQAGLKRRTGLAMPALILAANLPDIDAPCAIYGVESLSMRRGLTHGPIALVILPLLLAGALWWFDRWQSRRGKRPEGRLPVDFKWLLALCYIGAFTHPLFDWFNNYGIRLLEPFSSQWFYGDTLFIIDPWIIAMLGGGIWTSLRRERAGRLNWTRPAIASLIGILTFVALNLGITARHESEFGSALLNGGRFIASPVPVKFWQRQHIVGKPREAWYTNTVSLSGQSDSELRPVADHRCTWPDTEALSRTRPDLRAFLFWSRAPYAERSQTGDYVVIRDARFSGFGARDQFKVELRGVPCMHSPSSYFAK